MLSHTTYLPARGLNGLLRDALAMISAAWAALFGHPAADGAIDWEDGEAS